MDFKIKAVTDSQTETETNSWDLDIDGDNNLLTVDGDEEIDQRADIAASLESGSVPLVENQGVDWLGLLFKEKSLLEIDSQIRKNLGTFVDDVSYAPIYTKEGDVLKVQLSRININTGVV